MAIKSCVVTSIKDAQKVLAWLNEHRNQTATSKTSTEVKKLRASLIDMGYSTADDQMFINQSKYSKMVQTPTLVPKSLFQPC